MMWILSTVWTFWLVVVVVVASDCKVKHSRGQYSYIADVTLNKTYIDYSWSNETNHPVATKKSSSVSPVETSNPEMLVSSRNLGNLTLKRSYIMNKRLKEEIVPCYANAHMESHAALDDRKGQPKTWATVAGVAVAAVLLAIGIFWFWTIQRKKKKVPKAAHKFQPVDNPDNPCV
ncbi:uncharacterized protein LOC144989033 isoform X2 [Oryzias latipes]